MKIICIESKNQKQAKCPDCGKLNDLSYNEKTMLYEFQCCKHYTVFKRNWKE